MFYRPEVCLKLNPDYEARLQFKTQEHYSLEWMGKTFHTSVKFDTPHHTSDITRFVPSRGLMYISSTCISDTISTKGLKFVQDNNEIICRKQVYKVLRGMRKHGYL